jgi:hypothetical protein
MIKIYTALLKFQKEVPAIIKDKENPFFKSKYSDLASVINGVQETLSKCELGIIHSIETLNEINILTTILFHSSGESITSRIAIPPQNDPQKLGSLITYLKRYSYMAIIGVASENDDDDANNASNKRIVTPLPSNFNQQKEAVNTQIGMPISGKLEDMVIPFGKSKGKFLSDEVRANRKGVEWIATEFKGNPKLVALAKLHLEATK